MRYENIQVVLSSSQISNEAEMKQAIAEKLHIECKKITEIRLIRKSIDARKSQIKFNISADVYTDGTKPDAVCYPFSYKDVSSAETVVVVGAGPAGLFAALRLIEFGIKPIVIERGKSVSERKRDIAKLNRNQGLDPESNYAFGEGGAGTFSDGKLFSRLKKKKDCKRILLNFHLHGAADQILYEAHPHIGTDKLPHVISNMRETIIRYGGEVHFMTKMTDIEVENGQVCGVTLGDGKQLKCKNLILATGHSARDVYDILNSKGIELESKGFAMGVRIEHPQRLIDDIQYHLRGKQRGDSLPSAAYSNVAQVNGRGVYTFCMCPGGFIVPASTGEEETVVNGMSPSNRNSPFANSAVVVEIRPEDLSAYHKYGIMAGVEFQKQYERLSFLHGGGMAIAPAQRVVNFVRGENSSSLPKTSYLPGLVSSAMHEWIPSYISKRLASGLVDFDKRMKGFLTNEAILVGVESRTSSPIRIPRNELTLEHISVCGLYPCGEGAGYAGGITSSALDGEACAEKIAEKLGAKP